ncbi:MAG: COQ9 family protein [Alphaproteobacteria bacterium]
MQKKLHHPSHMALPHCQLADQIIERVLHHTEYDGWGDDALHHATKDIKCDNNLAQVIFPDVPKSLLIWASGYVDNIMIEWLKANKPEKITATIFHGLMFRYRHVKKWRGGLSRAAIVLTSPAHIITASELTWTTADRLWRTAGDDSNDFNHYSKRFLLSGIIAATLPVYLNDKTDDLVDTEKFLKNRLDDIKTINTTKTKIKEKIFGKTI